MLVIGRIAKCAAGYWSMVWNPVSPRPLAQQACRSLRPMTRRYHVARQRPTIGNMALTHDWLD
ncbi:hypothetical protein DGM85_16455 [Xanthomonas phaseoli pv. phaseoli]|nr:hypothetical protein DGM93_06235 [Xanthomonas phaseoli pv. phaseoli]QWN31163.1 hypothetical protein DGM85_16455 [Xanthomonas phaseoli pv. phaseoli]QWN35141.1 hypothetical protein DGM81_06260 [Xanthomonas phaseoli pv. phaseoli]